MSAKVLEMAQALARAKCDSSGISPEDASKLQLKALTPEETKELGYEPVASLYIPYFGPEGRPTAFYRIRYLQQLPGFAGSVKKPQRFAQPSNTLNEVYLPPLFQRSWGDLFGDSSVPIFITEGELKAACAACNNFPTIGLGGVDVWRSGKRGIDLLPALKAVNWKNRKVYIIFDKDERYNPGVVSAELKLAHELLEMSAYVNIINLPADDGKKIGLDDYLVAQGAEEFEKLLADSPAFSEASELNKMNEEVVYIKDPGFIVKRGNGQRIAVYGFKEHAYSHWHYKFPRATKNGTVWEEKKTANRWLEWGGRSTLNRMAYEPGKENITEEYEWNTWPGWGIEPKKGTTIPWHGLLTYIFKNDTDSRRWFEQWCAYPIQHPGVKMFTSSVLWSERQGTGKTLLGRTLMRIYGKNACEVGNLDLKESFNEWAANRQFVLGEEVVSSNKREDADKLKKLITQEELRVNEKYSPKYIVRDCINYLFTSNHSDAFFLEDTDRRYFVQEVVGAPLDLSFYQGYDAWYKSEGASYLFDHLLRVDLTGFNPYSPAPMTAAKEAMIVDNKSDTAAWVYELKTHPENVLPVNSKCDLFTSGELLTMLQQTADYNSHYTTRNSLGRELRKLEISQCVVRCPKSGVQRLWVVRNPEKWRLAEPRELGEHYDAMRPGANF